MSHIESLFSLTGKIAVVIGGTGELCGAMAETLAQAGAEVVLVGRSQEKANSRLAVIKEAGGSGCFIAADVVSRSGQEALLTEVLSRFGRCDILVNGAGANSPTPFLEIPEEQYEQIFEINTKAVFLACQVFGDYFVKNSIEASIINVGSMSGVIPLSRVFTYSMTKAAVHNLSKNLAREWAPIGIRVKHYRAGFFPGRTESQSTDTGSRSTNHGAHTDEKIR